jgi:hypothetical protein
MSTTTSIDQKKKLFQLPLKEDELEYWGPLNHTFCNSFLIMGNNFFEKYLADIDIKSVKSIFSAFVELVQNASEYNEENFSENIPQTYVSVKVNDGVVYIRTANQILDKDVQALRERLDRLERITLEELNADYKDDLINNKSLGLIMIKRMKNATFEWEFQQEGDQTWLSVELKIDYGKA